MFDEADPPRHKSDLWRDLAAEDLDKLSVAELDARLGLLEAELVRTRGRRDSAVVLKSAADALFRK